MASTSPYADQWAQLKSVHYALARVLDSTEGARLSDLDRERLQALVDVLKMVTQAAQGTIGFLPEQGTRGLRALRLPDLRDQIAAVQEFDAWKKPSKIGVDQKLLRLIQASEQFLRAQHLFATNVPREEFEVLEAIVRALVTSSEVALHA